MDFANPALANSSAEVRSAAVALVLQLAQAAGPSVQRMLPADLNAKVREQILQGLLNGPAAAAVPAALAAAKASAAARSTAAAAAGAAAGTGRQATAAAAVQQQAAAPPPPSLAQQQQPLAPPGPDADPAPYEAEVRAREARLGPSHPDVAEAVCNMAILHNQVGRHHRCRLPPNSLGHGLPASSAGLSCSCPAEPAAGCLLVWRGVLPRSGPRFMPGCHPSPACRCSVVTSQPRCRCTSARWLSGRPARGPTPPMWRTL